MLGVWCELVCEVCACVTAGRWCYGRIPRKQMKEEALKRGWKVEKDLTYCSRCAKLDPNHPTPPQQKVTLQ